MWHTYEIFATKFDRHVHAARRGGGGWILIRARVLNSARDMSRLGEGWIIGVFVYILLLAETAVFNTGALKGETDISKPKKKYF